MKWKPKQTDDHETPFIPEFVSDDYFSTQSLKRAVWQYLIDHSKITDGFGTIKFHFYIPNQEEFWRRVKARDDMRFRRIDEVQFQEKLLRKHKDVTELQRVRNKYLDSLSAERLRNFKINEGMKKGSFKERIMLKIATKMAKYSQKMIKAVIHI